MLGCNPTIDSIRVAFEDNPLPLFDHLSKMTGGINSTGQGGVLFAPGLDYKYSNILNNNDIVSFGIESYAWTSIQGVVYQRIF